MLTAAHTPGITSAELSGRPVIAQTCVQTPQASQPCQWNGDYKQETTE